MSEDAACNVSGVNCVDAQLVLVLYNKESRVTTTCSCDAHHSSLPSLKLGTGAAEQVRRAGSSDVKEGNRDTPGDSKLYLAFSW